MSDRAEEMGALSAEGKRALLTQLLQKQADKPKSYPLSYAQERLWFLDQLEPSTHYYNIFQGFELAGSLDITALEQSLQAVAQRHEALRTTFVAVDGRPAQFIAPRLEVPLHLVDLGDLPTPERQEAEAVRRATEEAWRPFDLAQGPLIRTTLLRLSETEHVFMLTLHHIVADGWSLGVFFHELAALYTAYAAGQPALLPELPLQYVDYAVWQREWLQGEVLETQRAYWRRQLAGATAVLQLPTDHPRPAVQTYQGAHQALTLPGTLRAGLQALSQQEGATLFMTLLAAFQVLLSRYTGQDDLVVGTPIAGRTRAELEEMIGFFANTLALRTDLSGNPTFRELLGRVREVALGAYAHQDLPFERLVEEVAPDRDVSHTPVFQAMLALEQGRRVTLELPGLQVRPLGVESGVAKFDLTLSLWEEQDCLGGSLEYNADLLQASTIARMAGHWQTLLEGLVADPEQRIGEVPLLTEEERRQILQEWNATRALYPRDVCIHQLFEAQVERTPDAVAVVFGAEQLTYRELNRRANQLAHHLQGLGVGPEVLVGLCVERSLELVVGLLGILKAGGAYVPLDPTFPSERLAFMLGDAQIPVLLTQERLLERLPEYKGQVVWLDTGWDMAEVPSQENLISGVTAENLAYVIYTSGSTGQPKGAMLPHHAICNRLLWALATEPLTLADAVLQTTSLGFDVSVLELFRPLLAGARSVLIRPGGQQDSAYLVKLMAEQHVTIVDWVPSLLEVLLEEPGLAACTLLRQVTCGGEPLPVALQQRYHARLGAELRNRYGPTEAAVDVTCFVCQPGSDSPSVPIGRPIANTQIYILDAQQQPVPIGVSGELYIGGAGLAWGYRNRPELTAEWFIPNPFSAEPGVRLYRTGDLARYLPDGTIEYLGRTDTQVKIRGYRIELGEIEAVLSQHPRVRACVVVTSEEVPGDKRLVAYVVPQPEHSALTSSELRRALQEQLPDYMVPSAFVLLEALPLTANGKVDRRALPAPDRTRPQIDAAYLVPRTELERTIAAIWQELLCVEQVGIHDNFFDLGGHSLLMVRAHAKLGNVLQRDISLIDLFKYPTVSSLAKYLSPDQGEQAAPVQQATSRAKTATTGIAIVGVAGRFPGAQDIEAFWRNLQAGVETVSFFSDEEVLAEGIAPHMLKRPNYVKAAAALEDIDLFDAAFFGFTRREAEIANPQQRFLLECAWQALENAGYDPATYSGRIGVYAGAGTNNYLRNLSSNPDLLESVGSMQVMIGNDPDFLATRVSYKLNLKGPSLNVYTGCSTSLVTVHLACQGLLNGECDMALAGGVDIRVPHKAGYLYQEEGIFSPDGHCRPFDARAQGTINGNGGGIVVLKRFEDALADGDCILAVIKGWAINNDGSAKVGYTAPSVEGQSQVISAALAMAGIAPETISYVEAHGTATPLGDPVEIAALTQAFRAGTQAKGFCAIGSLKSNVGHLNAAAGVGGLIKTVLALEHKMLPPSLHFEHPNPKIDFANSPFYVNARLTEWRKTSGTPRRAGVSSLGIGGTNAHVILEEAPPVEPSGPSRPWQVLLFSARTASALETATANLIEHVKQYPDLNLADVAYTLQVGRKALDHRRMLVCRDCGDLVAALEARNPEWVRTALHEPGERSVVFMFPGGGAQYGSMGAELYQAEPIFHEQVDRCAELLEPHLGLDLRTVLYPREAPADEVARQLGQPALALPALFVTEYALAQLWMAWGVRPKAMIGHSLGEYVAACLAGVFSLEDALAVVVARGQLMQTLPGGAMLVVLLPEEQVRPLLGEDLSLAAVNGPSLCVVSGPAGAIDTLKRELTGKGLEARLVPIAVASHSQVVEPILQPFIRYVEKVPRRAPRIPYVSNVTGTWITAAEATDPAYWARHLRQTVRFAAGLHELLREPSRVLLEVGPGEVLSTIARQHPARTAKQVALASLRHPHEDHSDVALLLHTLGSLWLAGVPVDWSAFSASERRHRLPLPTYPFERQRYWIERAGAPARETLQTIEAVQEHHVEEHLDSRAASAAQVGSSARDQERQEVSMSALQSAPVTRSARQERMTATLTSILANLIGADPTELDACTTFMEMGADSLALMQFSLAVQDQFGVKVAFRDLFEALPTIAALAVYLDEALPAERPSGQPSEQPAAAPQASAPTIITPQPVAQKVMPPLTESRLPVAPGYGAQVPLLGTALEHLFAQQLQVMSQQLDVLRNGRGSGGTPPPLSIGQPAIAEQAAPSATAALAGGATNGPQQQKEMAPSAVPAAPAKEAGAATPQPYIPYQPVRIGRGPTEGLTPRQRSHLDALIERYTKRTAESKRLTQLYRPCLADSRAPTGFRPLTKEITYPIITERSRGSRVWDVDGNEYIDLTMGFGVHLFGHSPDFVMEAVAERLKQGVELGPQSNLAGRVAQLICALTGVERVTFTNSGTEAMMAALRLARCVTRRTKIAMFAGSYHGTFDGVLAIAQLTDGTPRTLPMAPGIIPHMVEDVLVLEYDSPRSLEILEAHAHELAAVVVEPVQSRRPDLQPRAFLHALRAITERAGAALIFDEIITGFRIHPGGCQAWFDVRADLVTYGKVVGGGMPIGIVAGKRTYMDAMDGGMWSYGDASYPRAEQTMFAGTFCKHPLAMAAALAVLDHMQSRGPALQEELNQRTAFLAEQLDAIFTRRGVPLHMVRFGSLFRIVFPRELKYADLFYYHLNEQGVYVWEGRTYFLSTAHTDDDIEYVIRAVEASITKVQAGGFLPDPHPDGTNGGKPVPHQALSAAGVKATPSGSPDGGASPSRLPAGASNAEASALVGMDAEPVATAPDGGQSDRLATGVHRVPLTDAQKQLWFLAQIGDNASRAYNESAALRMRGPLDVTALRQALQAVVNRHEALRTTFSEQGDYQQIAPAMKLEVPLADLSGLAASERSAEMARRLTQEVEQPFDLARGPLLRAQILKLEEQSHLLVLTFHHIAVDGWSQDVLLGELKQLYSAYAQGLTPHLPSPMQLSAYVEWQARQQQSPEVAAAEAYWLQHLAGPLPILELPSDRPRPAVQTYAGARERMRIETELYSRLRRFSAQQSCTLFMTLLAGFQAFLHRLTGQDDIIVGVLAAGQALVDGKGLMGHCVNVLPLRTRVVGAPTLAEHLRSTKKLVLDAYSHQSYSFINLVNQLHIERDPSRSPLVAVIFNLDQPQPGGTFHDLKVEAAPTPVGFAKFDLHLNIAEIDNELWLESFYNTDLFDAATLRRWMGIFQTVLGRIVADPDQRLTTLPLLAAAEHNQVVREWNATQTEYPRDACLHQLFEAQVERTPEAVAVAYEGESLSYRELNRRANQLAHHLCGLGVGPEARVGIFTDRSPDLLVGLLGILKAGGAYVPLDPTYPKGRLAFVLEDAQVPVLLTQARLREQVPASAATLLCLDTDWEAIVQEHEEDLGRSVRADNLAYVMYTSGSTGKPKGVQIPHAAVVNFLCSMRQRVGLTPRDTLLAVTSVAFDIAGLELFLPLLLGARVVLASRETASAGDSLIELLRSSDATIMQATPATWRLLLDAGWAGSDRLTILSGGEALARELANQLGERCAALWNLYGPTETTIWSATCQVPSGAGPVPIGAPIANTQIYVLDAQYQPVPVGVPGEIYIGGHGVARGYLNQPELTAERFLPDPFTEEPGARLYRTGDLARYRADGTLDYLGRLDHQVKIRGYRIEPGEIEVVLRQHPAVRESMVVARADAPEDTRLVAYVVPDPHYQGPEQELSSAGWQAEQVAQWQTIWDETYREAGPQHDPTFNISGWKSSYTYLPIPDEEMREWVEHTVERIRALRPSRVLEIGCGTGLLLFRIAPDCTQYCGTDFSTVALDAVQQELAKQGLHQVTLLHQSADDFEGFAAGSYDAVILNSVVQYFPSAEYLVQVLEGALKTVAPGGFIFLGDVRSLPLLETVRATVQLYQAPASLSRAELQQRVRSHVAQEEELIIDPAFFIALKRRLPQVSQVQIQLKRGRHHNELTRFRYDVVLRVGPDMRPALNPLELDWREDNVTLASVHHLLAGQAPDLVRINDVPNARLVADVQAYELLMSDEGPDSVGELREALGRVPQEASVDPEVFWALSDELPYAVDITWSGRNALHCYDVVLARQELVSRMSVSAIPSFSGVGPRLLPWAAYTNNPLRAKASRKLVPEWRNCLKQTLPEYMVPAAFVVLDALPLTPNGKIDRRALPSPSQARPALEAAYLPPQNEVERAIAMVWQEVLGIEKVGVHDNFFDLGGHSLLMVQVRTRLRAVLPKDVSIVDLFKYPTISLLTRYVSQEQAEEPAHQRSQARGESRRKAVQQQRGFRQRQRVLYTAGQEPGGQDE